jgi:hypothetical protein
MKKKLQTTAYMAIKAICRCLIVLGDTIALIHAIGFLATLHLVGVF